MHSAKRGLRALGVAESFAGRERSILGGVVMRRDLRVDGMAIGSCTVGGMDATDAVIRLFETLERRDINVLLVSGAVIAWYNIIDAPAIARAISLPVIVVTYEASEGLADDIAHHFPGDRERLSAYERLGERRPVDLPTGYRVFVRSFGLAENDAARLCSAFTLDGRVPEPIRAARLLARAVLRCGDTSGVHPQDDRL
ncbi:MAG: DUF99 family protein [Methanobacteriota archaeon]|nr:MAG: DUF99 family protein [Euryarchaeota archaeon]